MENKLPEGWEIKKLVKHTPIIKTGVLQYNGEKPYYSTGVVDTDGVAPEGMYTFQNKPSRANRMVKTGDVVQARMQGTKKALMINRQLDDSLFSTGFIHFRPVESNYNAKLFYHYLSSELFLKQRDEYASGSTQIALTDKGAKNIDLIVPPADCQERIADKLDSLLSKVKDAQSRLNKIPIILKRLRQSILASIFYGSFIQSEYDNYELGTLDVKMQTGPFGSTLHKSDYIDNGIPVINPMHIINSKIVPSQKVSINKVTFDRLKNYALKSGDIVFARRGEMGRCAVVEKKSEGFLCGTGSIFLRFDTKKINPEYLQMLLSSPPSVNYLSGNAVGSTMLNLNQTILKQIPIPLPSFDEQKNVVNRAKVLFDNLIKIENRFKETTKYTDKIEQSILAKAFRGELVR